MWFLACAAALLVVSGLFSARQWLYGWHRENPLSRLRAAGLHLGLTGALCLVCELLGWGNSAAVLLLSVCAGALGFLVVKRNPPRELSRAHIPTSDILKR